MKTLKGQALVELAVFGAIFLMILGVMVSYGLRYSFDLQVKHQAYRRALAIASDPHRGSASYSLMIDKQIPDMTNPYGIGSNTPFIASSSVTRSTATDASFNREYPSRGDLPTTVMDVQTYATNSGAPATITRHIYANAGVRIERKAGGAEWTDNEVTKYQFIYGDARRNDSDKNMMTIVDACSGEVVDHSTCWDQARRLVDVPYCLRLCNGTYTPADEDAIGCPELCGQVLNPPNQTDHSFNPTLGGPWYAANWTITDGMHVFPILDQLFDYAGEGKRSMGIQSNERTESLMDTNLRKIETSQESATAAGTITTEEDATWSETKEQTFVWHDNIQPNGYEVPRARLVDYTGDVRQQPIYSTYEGQIHETWRTPK